MCCNCISESSAHNSGAFHWTLRSIDGLKKVREHEEDNKVCASVWKNSRDTSVQSLSRVRLFVTPWTAAHQASLSFAISQSLLKLMSSSR